jgi:hypothetical protein
MKCIMNPTNKLDCTGQNKPKPVNVPVSDKLKNINTEKLKKPLPKSNSF